MKTATEESRAGRETHPPFPELGAEGKFRLCGVDQQLLLLYATALTTAGGSNSYPHHQLEFTLTFSSQPTWKERPTCPPPYFHSNYTLVMLPL
jgi:hypothetical protein